MKFTTGSTVRSIYPNNIPGYRVDWFAEYMLPEGAHNRDVDFTYIFLNRTSRHVDEDYWTTPFDGFTHTNTNAEEESSELSHEKKPSTDSHFLYGLNMVKTKYDSSVRRGAIVKAMCVFSKYHYIEALKKPLEMALESYFLNPAMEVIESFFNSLNAIELSHVPRPDLLEQCLMRRGVCYDPITEQSINYQPKSWHRMLHYSFENVPRILSIPIYRTPDEVGDINISNLVRTFGILLLAVASMDMLIARERVIL